MPTRMLHEKICDSVTLAELTGDEERLFHRLVVKADDYGRFHAHPSLLLGACFPLLIEKISVEQVRAWRDRLADVGLIALYSVDGREYLRFLTWVNYQRQRGSKSKFPPPLEGAEIRGELPQAADVCGSRVVKTGGRKTIDVDVDDRRGPVAGAPAREAAPAANGATAPNPAPEGSTPAKKSSETPCPSEFPLDERHYAYAAERGFDRARTEAITAAFLKHHRFKGTLGSDWFSGWQGWVDRQVGIDLRDQQRAPPTARNGHSRSASGSEALSDDLLSRIEAREQRTPEQALAAAQAAKKARA
jgi:hypothetical protein